MKLTLPDSLRGLGERLNITHQADAGPATLPQTSPVRDPLVTVLNGMLEGTGLKITKRETAIGDADFDHPRKFVVEATGKASGDALEIAAKITAFKTTLGIHGKDTEQELSPELGKGFSITLSRKDFQAFEQRADITAELKKITAPKREVV